MEDACEKRTPEVPAADPIVQYIVVRKVRAALLPACGSAAC